MVAGSFESLSPGAVVRAVEDAYALPLDGTLEAYPSYVNRVYGIRGEDGARYVAKFYRPGRWTRDAILDEHQFLLDCAEAEVPVIAPLPAADGGTLRETMPEGRDDGQAFLFALFPRTGGRTYEPESGEDLRRLGALLGRCHAVAARRTAPQRAVCTPQGLTAGFVEELLADELVHPECRDEFKAVCDATLQAAAPLFEGLSPSRIHGDCHRGNIIDRAGQGLVLIDFDDMMMGPPAQDIWLVLPGYASESRRELAFLLEGYEQFAAFDRETLKLIEPLRFMRMIYFLAWRARQRGDYWFRESFPEWGSEAFWMKETEDLRVQAQVIHTALRR
ncbi:MAG: serine/threonine protein kinase [Spirochaetia bacterium]|jgi:Ser/Thr protein kinase RdoA (MazF antagonist)